MAGPSTYNDKVTNMPLTLFYNLNMYINSKK